jgi:hypothetical protein
MLVSERFRKMPRESIQITGIHIEHLNESGGIRVTVRTPDNSSFTVHDDEHDNWPNGGTFISAQQILKLKREAQKKVTDERANPDRTRIQ